MRTTLRKLMRAIPMNNYDRRVIYLCLLRFMNKLGFETQR